jgi:hypothetical protein
MEQTMVILQQRIFRSFFRCFLSCLLCALWSTELLAQPVSPEMARKVAANWIRQKTGVQKKVLASFAGLSAIKSPQSTVPDYYTFTMEGGGWVIVAGDDVAYPVIGYGLQGSAKPEKMPPALKEWMMRVQEAIRSAAQKEQAPLLGNTVVATNSSAWKELTAFFNKEEEIEEVTAVFPLLRTTWSQGRYYNTLCPYDSSAPDWADHRTFVGCVATAMGQVMKYHNWPDQGVGSHSYNHPTYGILAANFGATNYNWGSMPSSGSVTAYNTAVATLLYHAGVSVDMDYGPDGSGAYTAWVATALKTFFKYKPTATFENRSSYSTSAWEYKIRMELDAHRPLVYRGHRTGGVGGHAFVCDGYSGTNYFHFNWGWNGWYDGYFYLSDLTPGDREYNSYQGAIFGIEPDGKQEQKTVLTSIFSLLLRK